MLNEFVYCPRLFFYEWVDGVFAHSADTLEGKFRHEKLAAKADPMPPPEDEGPIHSRSVMLSSDRLGVIARMDLVEGDSGSVSPVEYKKGRPRGTDEGPEAWPADRVQVSVQALILRDNAYRCDEAVLYYSATKQRVRVPIDEELVRETESALLDARALARSGRIPPPLDSSPKCPRCSLVGICLPDETAFIETLPAEDDRQLNLFPEMEVDRERSGAESRAEVRRLVPARDDLRPLYVTGHGLTIGKSGGLLQIKERGKPVRTVRLGEISQVNVFGNVQLTAGAVQVLCRSDRPVAHFSYGGWFYGTTCGMGLKNVFLRKGQFARADDATFCLLVSRRFVKSKIRNQRTLLRRNHIEPSKLLLSQLDHYADLARTAKSIEELLGIEGTAARLYFGAFPGMLKADEGPQGGEQFRFDFAGRNRRPPRDPVNAMLSFAYSLLAKDLTFICHAVGFDPFLGFFHQPRFGRPALALDLMEEFRPLVADSVVLTAINTGAVTPESFVTAGNATNLSPAGRKAFLRAYEHRMDTLATHPLFGYRVNYRRLLEIQARLLGRVVTGEIAAYQGFETR